MNEYPLTWSEVFENQFNEQSKRIEALNSRISILENQMADLLKQNEKKCKMTIGELKRLNYDSDMDTIVIYSCCGHCILKETPFHELDKNWFKFEVSSFNVLPKHYTLAVKFNVYVNITI